MNDRYKSRLAREEVLAIIQSNPAYKRIGTGGHHYEVKNAEGKKLIVNIYMTEMSVAVALYGNWHSKRKLPIDIATLVHYCLPVELLEEGKKK